MYLKELELAGFKSFAKKTSLEFSNSVTAIVGPNGSGKSNVAEAFRFVLGEQSFKSMRTKKGEDLIWGGSEAVARSGRASVRVVFDNSKRLLDLDFDEVSVERVVHRDGVNEYLVNGSRVRLRDVIELLAGANIGASGHHIISQGEADRILSASIRERREMVEDALGLKVYQYKKQESERKLDRTTENISQVESLRKEIQPHLKFLEKQVAKIEQSKELRETLTAHYLDYLKREHVYLSNERKAIETEWSGPKEELAALDAKLADARKVLEGSKTKDDKSDELLSLERELSDSRRRQDELTRELGRVEGELAVLSRREKQDDALSVSARDIEAVVEELQSVEAQEDVSVFRHAIQSALGRLRAFLSGRDREAHDADTTELTKRKGELDAAYAQAKERERSVEERYSALQQEMEAEKDEARGAERELFQLSARQTELRLILKDLEGRFERLELEEEEWKREISEAIPLVGRAVTGYQDHVVRENGAVVSDETMMAEKRTLQQERKRAMEKMKVRLEELSGGASEDILKEHQEVKERDLFLTREIDDLERSAESLRSLITELDEKLNVKFKEGIAKINTEFQTFFSLMFGGGTASLAVVKEEARRRRTLADDLLDDGEGGMGDVSGEEETPRYEGIDIRISLPRKRIKSLEMLSGGERALTSIALIFAVSQVNPPPFLVLDETDAALDEANSRRYGDMIENLSKKSQLILITHNRQTMSRAGVLYGVTMGADGVSKLLSVKFDDAVKVAK